MWTKTHTVTSNKATKEQIWKLFSDVNAWSSWDDTIDNAMIDWEFVIGNTFILKPRWGPKVRIKLIEVTPNHSFTDMTQFPLARMYGEHLFEEVPEWLRMTTTMRVEWPLSWVWTKIVAEWIMRNIHQDMMKQVEVASKL